MTDPYKTPSSNGNYTNDNNNSAKSTATLVYILQAASFIIGITFFVAIIINYVKQDDVKNTIVESHFRWQIRTFWFCLLWTVLGIILSIILVGYLVLAANAIWFIYRIVKGWIYLNDNKTMYS